VKINRIPEEALEYKPTGEREPGYLEKRWPDQQYTE